MGQLIECGGIGIDCGVDQFENMVAFYTAAFGAEVVHHEKRSVLPAGIVNVLGSPRIF